MRFTNIIALGLAVTGGLAAPRPTALDEAARSIPNDREEHLRVRKEWRQLTIPQRKDYIRAVKCMHKIPGIYRDIVPSSLTLWEDFAAVHKLQTPFIHFESQFLPWHRYFMWTFESTLRDRCNYEGALPYWDYGLDAPPNVFKDSPIFDVEHGFGGDGIYKPFHDGVPPLLPEGSGGGCQKDGPFKDWTIHIAELDKTGPRDDRCLTRSINAAVSRDWCRHEVEEVIKSQKDYKGFYQNMQGAFFKYDEYFGLHSCGHFVVAGPTTGADFFIGPADPLFYLHHVNLDRIWWEWQQKDLEKRVKDMTGRVKPPTYRFPGANYTGFPDVDITLDWPITVGRLAPDVPTRKLMHIGRGALGYKYTNPYAKYVNGEKVDDGEAYKGQVKTAAFQRKMQEFNKLWAKYKEASWSQDK
ncbi:hypothetical protein BDD12DRAFT_250431 [Trichophaea hybrida]|nr:hypothetical protein BDD12DRAFT_250431 [Trichophaea hybrida]